MKNKNIAMLIDGDNAQPKYLKNIIAETSKHGRITIKRIYGDWSSDCMKNWKKQLSTYSIRPMQEFANIPGKNATDIALVINAMDILYREEIDAFCIVSSDSDFTGLANRIRESGRIVIGIGKNITPKSFVNACDFFTFTESFTEEFTEEFIEDFTEDFIKKTSKLSSKKKSKITIKIVENTSKESVNKSKSKKKKKEFKSKKKKKIDVNFLRKALSIVQQKNGNGEAQLGQLSEEIRKLNPNFDVKKYGFKNFTSMFKSLANDFEMIYYNNNSTILIKYKI